MSKQFVGIFLYGLVSFSMCSLQQENKNESLISEGLVHARGGKQWQLMKRVEGMLNNVRRIGRFFKFSFFVAKMSTLSDYRLFQLDRTSARRMEG